MHKDKFNLDFRDEHFLTSMVRLTKSSDFCLLFLMLFKFFKNLQLVSDSLQYWLPKRTKFVLTSEENVSTIQRFENTPRSSASATRRLQVHQEWICPPFSMRYGVPRTFTTMVADNHLGKYHSVRCYQSSSPGWYKV